MKVIWVCVLVSVLIGCGGGADSNGPGQPTSSINPTSPSSNPSTSSPSSPIVTPTSQSDNSTVPSTTPNNAARLLTQATFGPTKTEIDAVVNMGIETWVEQQFVVQQSNHRAMTLAIFNADDHARIDNSAELPWSGHRYAAWSEIALHGKDQLRQRVAFALSQLFVVSDKSALDNSHLGLATYYDGLAEHAFGNYRDLLEFVTLSPSMGVYLNMLSNEKPDESNNIRPDENFAREVMQLFTIGLEELNLDGSLKMHDGQPIPTYDINTVKAYAHVFTGWNFYGTTYETWDNWWQNRNFRNQMVLIPEYHAQNVRKNLLNNVVVEAGTDGETAMQMALDSLFEHPNVGPFVARHLIQRLVTSNPSPAFIARTAQVFNDNGAGVRGDLGAVIKHILLDEEARYEIASQPLGYGKVKEPLIRGIQMIRAFGIYEPNTPKPQWYDYPFNQSPLSSPSVFNFFSDTFTPSGELNDMDLVAPELEIINDTYMVRNSNHAAWWSMWTPSTVEIDIGDERAMTIDFTPYIGMLQDDPEQFLDYLDLVLLSGSMNDAMRQAILDYDHVAKSWLSDLERVKEMVFMVTGSPQFAVQR